MAGKSVQELDISGAITSTIRTESSGFRLYLAPFLRLHCSPGPEQGTGAITVGGASLISVSVTETTSCRSLQRPVSQVSLGLSS